MLQTIILNLTISGFFLMIGCTSGVPSPPQNIKYYRGFSIDQTIRAPKDDDTWEVINTSDDKFNNYMCETVGQHEANFEYILLLIDSCKTWK